jgi:hypothetical protein
MPALTNNLPGFKTELKDGGLSISNNTNASTNSILLLGTAVDGPVKVPVPVSRLEDGKTIFGKISEYGVSNGATLLRGLHEAWNAGARDVRLMRVTGSEAEGEINADTITTNIRREKHENLGLASGNLEFTFTLANAPVYDKDRMTVYANGYEISPDDITVDTATGEVTVAKNAVDSDAEISIQYTYPNETVHSVTGENMVSNDQLDYISQNGYINFVGGSEIVYVNGTEQTEGTDYTVDETSGTITFMSALAESDEVTADFDYTETEDITTSESTDGAGDKWVAAGSAQVMDVEYKAIATSVNLYADGQPVADDGFSVNSDQKKVILNSGYAPVNASLTVSYVYRTTKTETPSIELTSIYGGSLYNNITAAVEDMVDENGTVIGKKVVITKPAEKKAEMDEEPLEYSSVEYPRFNALVKAINDDPRNNIVNASTDYGATQTVDLQLVPANPLKGGDDGMAFGKDELYEVLAGKYDEDGEKVEEGIYDLLRNYNVDMIVLLDGFADDVLASDLNDFAYQLAEHCATVSAQNNETFGLIGTKSIADANLAGVNDFVNRLTEDGKNEFELRNKNGALIMDDDGNPIDIGNNIGVVAGPDFVFEHPELGNYYANGAAAIAGLISTLSPESAPTNKKVKGVKGLRYTLSPSQLGRLSDKQYLTARSKYGKGVVITDGLTAAQPTSDYARISTMRITNAAVSTVREESDPFVGEPNELEYRNALATAIQSGLDRMKERGALRDFEFAIHSSLQDQVLGKALIELTLVPAFEMREITTVVSLKPEL